MLIYVSLTGAWYHESTMNKPSGQSGFTLLELFVVVAAIIIALLVVFSCVPAPKHNFKVHLRF